MKVIISNLKDLLYGQVQYRVPIYQRDYDWESDQCQKLIQDICDITELPYPSHFLGAMIYMDNVVSPGECRKIGIVDGQQRMTTMSILFKSMMDHFIDKGVNLDFVDDISDYLQFERRHQRINKMVLKKTDNPVWEALLNNNFKQIELNTEWRLNNIYRNYKYFRYQLSMMLDEDIIKLFNNSDCLQISSHSCERGKDDPQTIFQDFNSTGKELNHSDLILNYSLQLLDEPLMEETHDKYWLVIKQRLGDNLEDFFRSYVTIKRLQKPKERELFDDYKKIKGDQLDIIKDLERYSSYYDKIWNGGEVNKKIRVLLDDGLVRTKYIRFFLLYLYNDYSEGVIDDIDFVEVLKFLRNYIIRRNIYFDKSRDTVPMFCELMELLDICKRDSIDKYVEQIKVFFLLQTRDELKIPSDKEVVDSLLTKDLYLSPYKEVILYGLERWFNPKEVIDFSKLSIEHILPQNPQVPQSWKDELGGDYLNIKERLCHNLGNLTLTGYNSELSDRSYSEKKMMVNGLNSSSVNLNKYFANINIWNEDSIVDRCKYLGDIINKVFPYPDIDSDVLETYKNHEIEKIPYFTTHKMVFEYLVEKLGLERCRKSVFSNKVVFDSYQIKFNKKSIIISQSDSEEQKVIKNILDVDKHFQSSLIGV